MENRIILTESTRKSLKSTRKYKCPYCDTRLDREKLIDHIDKKHIDMVPEGYTPARIVFNTVNHKTEGYCVIDKKPTAWNEDLCRYERYCCDKCREVAAARAKENMIKVYGKETLLNDPHHQEKMLKGRSISGTYKFTSGGTIDYVGSYEKEFLEFCDKVMKFKRCDFGPAPIIPYTYNGEKHIWITDFYLEPYNLVFDIKDGGDNPNNRDMKSYREKQIAKETAIANMKEYNYIRLTDNNFAQLLLVLAELKLNMMNENDKHEPLIKINENVNMSSINENHYSSLDELCGAVMGAMVGINNNPSAYIVPYIKREAFDVDYAMTDDESLEHILTMDENGYIIPRGKSFLENCKEYSLFKYKKVPFQNNKGNMNNIYEVVTGKKMITPDQLLYDEDFEQVLTDRDKEAIQTECFVATLESKSVKVPVINENYIMDDSINFYNDDNGYFVENARNGYRSKSYNSLDSIPNYMIRYIRDGLL